MAVLRHVATLLVGAQAFRTGITDLATSTIGGGVQLYATTRPGGGLSAFGVDTAGTTTLLSQQSFVSGVTHLSTPKIAVLQGQSGDFLMPVGMTQAWAGAWALDGVGNLAARMAFPVSGQPPADLIALTGLTIGGHSYMITSRKGLAGPQVFEAAPGGGLATVSSAGTAGPDLTGLAGLVTNGQAIVVGVSPVGNQIVSYKVGADGQTQQVATLESLTSGIGFDTPVTLDTVVLDGAGYAIVAGAGSSSLTVLRVLPDGQMQAVDHVIDSLTTRFQSLTSVKAVTLGDRVFVLAGGADDGISLFTLLPGGRLIHLAALADTAATSLQNVSAIAAVVAGGQVQVFAVSEAEPGITQLVLETGVPGRTIRAGAGQTNGTDGDDLLMAGAATTGLSGGAGDDLLVSADRATGPLEMWGGAGRDHFIAAYNSQHLTIMDFQPGLDRLDLSLFPMLHNVQQLEITKTAHGAVLRYGATVIELISDSQQAIAASYFTDAGLLGLTRYAPYIAQEKLNGTAQSDQMTLVSDGGQAWGLEGNDTITSSMADAYIDGGAGDDLIQVSQGQNHILGGLGDDTILGGSGGDVIEAGAGRNFIQGNDGNDLISGGSDADFIDAGAGNDTVLGGAGNDSIYLGAGDDFSGGGAGDDLIYAGAGANLIYTGYGRDSVYGGSGADTIYGAGAGNILQGNAGDDQLYAGSGGDFLAGGAGNDRVFGSDGNDTIYLGLGNDFSGGGAGDDLIFGGAGANLIYTGYGRDTVYGGSGADVVYGAGGPNILLGNDGNDTIYAGASGDFLAGGAGNDVVLGGGGNDTIYLGAGDDFAGGGAGNDVMFAGAGANRIYAGYGDDTVNAGYGRDVITGGPGADHFVFASAAQIGIGAARDVITDFTPGQDKIDLSAMSLTFIGAANFSNTAGELHLLPGYVVGDINGDGINDFAIELPGAPTLSVDDFIL